MRKLYKFIAISTALCAGSAMAEDLSQKSWQEIEAQAKKKDKLSSVFGIFNLNCVLLCKHLSNNTALKYVFQKALPTVTSINY